VATLSKSHYQVTRRNNLLLQNSSLSGRYFSLESSQPTDNGKYRDQAASNHGTDFGQSAHEECHCERRAMQKHCETIAMQVRPRTGTRTLDWRAAMYK